MGTSNLSGTNNYAAYGGSLPGGNNSSGIQFTRDEFGNTVPLPLQNQGTLKNDQLMYMEDGQ
jgi:hypothetical protein